MRTAATLFAASLVTSALLSCGSTSTSISTSTDAAASQADEFALIVATDGYELHLRAGRVYVVKPGAAPARLPVQREVRSYERFRDLYARADAGPLPSAVPSEGVQVNGWRDLECVREGHVCGRKPEPGSRGDAVRLRIVFPN